MATTIDETRPRAFEPGLSDRVGTSTATPGWDVAVERRIDDGETLARSIGWFSIGLGVAEIAAPDRIAEYLGMEEKSDLIRLYGLREIAKGTGILASGRPTSPNWLWARVAGDLLDLATLATGLTQRNRHRDRVLGAMAAVAGVTVLDVICARQLSGDRYRWDSKGDRAQRLEDYGTRETR